MTDVIFKHRPHIERWKW